MLGVGLALAVVGWGLGTQIETVSDIRSLAPQSLPAVRNLTELQDTTGVSGELDVSVEAPDLSDPATIEWMAAFKQRVLRDNGFSGENPSCLDAEVCPGPALSDFLTRGEGRVTRQGIEATLAALSPYSLRQVAPLDPRTGQLGHTALISFGIRAQSLEDQQALIDRVRSEIGEPGAPGGPPPGVVVQLAGLPVIAAESASSLSASRYWLTLAGLLAVAFALAVVYRSPRRALVPLVPTVLATGWASLVLWVSGIPLNPMSAALGALTIAIATEFGVILAGRFHEERGGSRGWRRPCAGRLRPHRRRGPRLRGNGHRRLRRALGQRHSDAARLRLRHRDRSLRGAVRGAGGAAGGPGLGGGEMKDRYSLVVGLLFLILVAVATLHTLGGGGGEDTLGLDRQPPRWPLPEFAVPAAAGGLEGDANVAQDDCESAAVPCPSGDRRTPACRISTPGAIRVCDLFDRPLVISFWFTKGGGCAAQQDIVDAVYQRYRGRVNFLSLDVRDSRETVRELIRQNGWKMPVGYDRDGAVASLYKVGGCPTLAYVYPGGTLQSAATGDFTAAQLDDRIGRLLDATRAAEAG